MKTICLYFEIHQITHPMDIRFDETMEILNGKKYIVSDDGEWIPVEDDNDINDYYYDDYENERSINYIVENSYIPALNTLQDMLEQNPGFKVSFSISGVGMEQLETHAPQVLEKLQQLNSTGRVEFLSEPYSHGLAGLANEESFRRDITKMSDKINEVLEG